MATERISPTALYTGALWEAEGLSPRGLVPAHGRLLFGAVSPLAGLARRLGAPSLDGMLLARHRLIDRVVEAALARGDRQVLELAAGLSGRGRRMVARHPGLRYVEADLPAMAARKRARLRAIPAGLEVVGLDALAPGSLDGLDLDPAVGALVITEGLLNYLDEAQVLALWRAVARYLGPFVRGTYVAEVLPADAVPADRTVRWFKAALGAFTRGRVHLHHRSQAEAEAALRKAGFTTLTWHAGTSSDPPSPLVQVVEATVRAGVPPAPT